MKISDEARELVRYVFGCHTCKSATFPSPTYHHDLAGDKIQTALDRRDAAAYNRGLEDAKQYFLNQKPGTPQIISEIAATIEAMKVKP